VDLDLETLKTEILDYLAASDFAIFRCAPETTDHLPYILWDTERFPDYRMFLETARKAGQNMVLFSAMELDESTVDEAKEQLADATMLSREDQRELERRIRTAERNVGSICGIELAFDHNSHIYLYEARPDWFEEFRDACDELDALLGLDDGEEDESQDGLGGFYSNN
jgi:hypothetical protein